MPCEYLNKCVTRATVQQLSHQGPDAFQRKYILDGGRVSPIDAAHYGGIVLNGEYCSGDPTRCQAWKEKKGI